MNILDTGKQVVNQSTKAAGKIQQAMNSSLVKDSKLKIVAPPSNNEIENLIAKLGSTAAPTLKSNAPTKSRNTNLA